MTMMTMMIILITISTMGSPNSLPHLSTVGTMSKSDHLSDSNKKENWPGWTIPITIKYTLGWTLSTGQTGLLVSILFLFF